MTTFDPMWDKRFADSKYAYGVTPNDFLNQHTKSLNKGNVLTIAEGEGRNAVFLAKLGFDVTAVDASIEGIKKAQQLADKHQVDLNYIHADLATFDFGKQQWDNIVSIFAPFGRTLRSQIHQKITSSLKPNGIFLIEAYTPEQIKFATGGGPDLDTMPSKKQLIDELSGLEFSLLSECERSVIEGVYHTGQASVVQGIAKRVIK